MKPGRAGIPCAGFLRQHGVECRIVAPSKVPAPAGRPRENGPARCGSTRAAFARGELTGIYVPEPQDEAVRDLIRARYQVQKQPTPGAAAAQDVSAAAESPLCRHQAPGRRSI